MYSFCIRHLSLSMFLKSTHDAAFTHSSLLLLLSIERMDVPQLDYPFTCWWTFLGFGYNKWKYYECSYVDLFVDAYSFLSLEQIARSEIAGFYSIFNLDENVNYFAKWFFYPTLPCRVWESSSCFLSSPIFGIISRFNICHSNGHAVIENYN